eukprot:GDKH01002634.1.p4 GENE.GDKH01002634.1~~GDKH01002634.1.p4  ORF type:complete len:51 (+),score=0.36 GDKH01002634.1:152-304(+)
MLIPTRAVTLSSDPISTGGLSGVEVVLILDQKVPFCELFGAVIRSLTICL